MLLSRVAIVALAATSLTCNMPGPPCSPDSPYPEACGLLDSGMDSGARMDAAVPPVDASRDSGPRPDGGPLDPGWRLLPDLPPGCVVERAEYPERIPVPEWESCGPGCLRARANAVPGVDWLPTRVAASTAAGSWAAMLLYRNGDDGQVTMLTTADGPVAAAWRNRMTVPTDACILAPLSADPSRAVAVIRYCGDDMCRVESDDIFVGAVDEIGRADRATLRLTDPVVQFGRLTTEVAVADSYLAVLLQPRGSLYRSAGGVLETLHDAGAWEVRAQGDHTVWSDGYSTPWRLMHYTPARGTEPYYAPADDFVQYPFIEGDTLYFMRFVDWSEGRWARAELWATPFVEDPSEVSPRLIHDDVLPDGRWSPTLYAKVRAFEPELRVQIIDLADGRERVMGPPEVGARCIGMTYASATEIMLECAVGRNAYLYRVDPSLVPYVD